jgi:phosphoribosyl-ATP pyrophosphohydrolase
MDRSRSGIRRESSREGRYVLVPDPKVVRKLLTRYASLRIAQAEKETEASARELTDVTYTLCVMMGATDIHEAVAKADALLLAAGRMGPERDLDEGEELPLAV